MEATRFNRLEEVVVKIATNQEVMSNNLSMMKESLEKIVSDDPTVVILKANLDVVKNKADKLEDDLSKQKSFIMKWLFSLLTAAILASASVIFKL